MARERHEFNLVAEDGPKLEEEVIDLIRGTSQTQLIPSLRAADLFAQRLAPMSPSHLRSVAILSLPQFQPPTSPRCLFLKSSEVAPSRRVDHVARSPAPYFGGLNLGGRRMRRDWKVSITIFAFLISFMGVGGIASMAVASVRNAPRQVASHWHIVKRSQTWGLSVDDTDCTNQLRCVSIASHKGTAFAVRLNAAGILSVSRVATKPIPDGLMSCTTLVNCQAEFVKGSVDSSNLTMSLFRTTDAGVHWFRDAQLPEPVIRGFACSTPTRCLAAASTGESLSASSHEYRTTNGGVSWTETTLAPLPAPHLVAVNCGIGGACITTNRFSAGAAAITIDLGETWKKLTVPVHKAGISSASCIGSSVCQLILESPGPKSSSRLFLWTVAQSNGHTVAIHAIGFAHSWALQATCGSERYCSLVIWQSADAPRLMLTSNFGATWLSESLPASLGVQPSIWCGSGGHCLGFTGAQLIEVRN